MTNLKTILEARRRIKAGESLDKDHYAILDPMFAMLEKGLMPKDRVPFIHSTGGYLIGSEFFLEQDGFEYSQRTIQQGNVLSIVLWSRDHLGSGGALLGPEPGIRDDYDVELDDKYWEPSPYQGAGRQEIFSIGMAQKMLARIDELNAATATPERVNTIEFLEGELRRHRYKREIKSFDDEAEMARKAVERAITRAIAKLIETPETQEIGLHLQANIVTGNTCEYHGDWKWEFQKKIDEM